MLNEDYRLSKIELIIEFSNILVVGENKELFR